MGRVNTLFQRMVAEFFGTFILVMTVCCLAVVPNPLAGLAIAASLMVGVYSLGGVSGAHFNPAVSVGLFVSGQPTMGHYGLQDFNKGSELGSYVLMQLLAGFFAALSAGWMYGTASFGAASSHLGNSAVGPVDLTVAFSGLDVANTYCNWQKMVAEALYTCLLVFVVLNVATKPTGPDEPDNNYFGLAIGFVIVAAATSIGHVSGACLNPAVSLGVAFGSAIFGSSSWGGALFALLLFIIAQLAGAIIAVVAFHAVRRTQLERAGQLRMKRVEQEENEFGKLIAEFLGTFYLVLTVCLTSCDNSKPVLAVVGIASSLMVMIFALGNVSGANFNPAVSLALGMRGVLEWVPVFEYIFTQLVAGFCATSVAKLLEQSNYDLALVAVAEGPLRVAARGSWGQIFGAEFFFTFLLVFVVLNVAVVKEDGGNAPNDYFGLAIGACVIVGGTAVGALTGGCFNPAVSFGVGIGGIYARSDGGQNGWFIVYWLAEFLAGAFAAGVARVIRGHANSYRDLDAEKAAE